jgi:anti-sigma factor RsiW
MPPADRARFEEHIAGCDGCAAYLEQMRATIRLAGRLTPDAVPPEAERALLSAFRSWSHT